jgi:hypothetical protein
VVLVLMVLVVLVVLGNPMLPFLYVHTQYLIKLFQRLAFPAVDLTECARTPLSAMHQLRAARHYCFESLIRAVARRACLQMILWSNLPSIRGGGVPSIALWRWFLSQALRHRPVLKSGDLKISYSALAWREITQAEETDAMSHSHASGVREGVEIHRDE